ESLALQPAAALQALNGDDHGLVLPPNSYTHAHFRLLVCVQCYAHHRVLHSFPTRALPISSSPTTSSATSSPIPPVTAAARSVMIDRKSTRLNSSHVKISYAVFCLKKKICRSHYRKAYDQSLGDLEWRTDAKPYTPCYCKTT